MRSRPLRKTRPRQAPHLITSSWYPSSTSPRSVGATCLLKNFQSAAGGQGRGGTESVVGEACGKRRAGVKKEAAAWLAAGAGRAPGGGANSTSSSGGARRRPQHQGAPPTPAPALVGNWLPLFTPTSVPSKSKQAMRAPPWASGLALRGSQGGSGGWTLRGGAEAGGAGAGAAQGRHARSLAEGGQQLSPCPLT